MHEQAPAAASRRGIKDNTVFGRTFTVALLQGFILLLASLSSAFAQTYPVRASVQLLPPYSVYLSDYSSPTTDRLVLNLLSLDTKEPEVEVRLHLCLENQAGQRLETRAAFRPPAIRLQAGVPLRLTGAELAQYLQPENLDLKGLNRNQFLRSGQLPEGVWQVCVEVREYYRDARLSLPGCASAWLVLNDPPLLNLPEQNAKLRAQEPQQLVFQWTPRHMGSPNAAFSTEYEFSLIEIWPEGRNPNEAMRTQLPLYQTITQSSMLVYGPGEPPLVPGRRYAWRVQARAQTGAENLDLFKNEGYSEVYSFQWGDACLAPLSLAAEALPGNRLKLQWQGQSGHSGYIVRYRHADSGRWYEKTTLNTDLILTELEAASRYEFAVVAQCGSIRGLATATDTLSTLPQEEVIFACGLPLQGFELDPTQLLERLVPGDVLQAGDFKVLVTEASGSGGTFSGIGIISPAWLKQAKLNVVWENVQVNQEYRLVSGEIKVTGSQLDVVPQELLDVLDALDELDSELEVIAGQLEQLDSLAAAHHGPTQQVQQDKRIDSVWVDSSTGHIYVATEGGTQHRYPPYTDAQGEPQPVYVADSKGSRYVVDAAGQLHNLSQEPVPYNIRFVADANQKGGFDSLRIAALAGLYEPLVLGGEMQRISWKSILAGQSDGVWVSVSDGSFPQEVKFRNSTGPVQVAAREGSRVKLLLQAPAAGLPDALIAYLEQQDSTGKAYEQQLGQLNLLGYNTLEQKLIVVPVGSQDSPFTAEALEAQLRQIYAPAHVEWKVAVKAPQSLSGWDEGYAGLDDGGSGLLASYTAEMRKLVGAYLEQEAEEQDAVYLFLVDKSQSGQKKGFMPRSRRHGFIFLDAHGGQQAELIKTIAHELGHGAYNLEHLFKAYPAVAESSTDNLMDYQATGTTMLKDQWNQVHDPVRVWGLFEEDEDGAMDICFWFKSTLSSWWPSAGDEQLNNKSALYAHVGSSFDSYLEKSKLENTLVTYDQTWSVRKSSFNSKSNTTIVQRVIKRLLEEDAPELSLHQKGIYLGSYLLEGKNYSLAIFSENEKFTLEKVQVDELCDLVDNSKVKVLINDSHTIISYFINNEIVMTIQIAGGNKETAKLWLKYLGLLIEQPSYLDVVKAYWSEFWIEDDHIVNTDEEISGSGSFRIRLYDGEVEKEENSVLLITADSPPQMPDIRARISGDFNKYQVKIVVVDTLYKRSSGVWSLVRGDITSLPDNSWKEVSNNEVWDVNFGNNFMGGEARIIVRTANENYDTLKFHIRGSNPAISHIRNFAATLPNGSEWYIPKMLRQESNFQQFNIGTIGVRNGSLVSNGERGVDNGGRPNWGPPYGWGMKQLDNLGNANFGEYNAISNRFGPSTNELWNWQMNVRKGIEFFNNEKMATAQRRWNSAYNRILAWERSNPSLVQDNYPMVILRSLQAIEVGTTITGNMNIGLEIFSSHHRNVPLGNRTLKEADALKYYNGGLYYELEIPSANSDEEDPAQIPQTPKWRVNKTQPRGNVQADYVQEISSRQGW